MAAALRRVSADANQRANYIWKRLHQSRAAERRSHFPSRLGGLALGAGGPPALAAGDGEEAASQPGSHLRFPPLQTQLIEGDRNSRKVENSSENVQYPACSQLHTCSRPASTARPRKASRA